MLAVMDVADVLGLPAKETAARSPFGLIARLEDGLPVAALDRLAQLLAPGDAQFKYKLVPKATYERRKLSHRLSFDEGTRLARLARVCSSHSRMIYLYISKNKVPLPKANHNSKL